MKTRLPSRALVGLATVAMLVAACGSSSKSSSGTTTTTLSVCQQAQALEKSITDLKNVNVVQNGTSALSAAVDTVKVQAAALATSGKSQLQPQVQDLQTSITALETSVKTVQTGGTGGVINAVAGVSTAASSLQTKVTSLKC